MGPENARLVMVIRSNTHHPQDQCREIRFLAKDLRFKHCQFPFELRASHPLVIRFLDGDDVCLSLCRIHFVVALPITPRVT